MHFGEPLDDERLAALLRPGSGIDTVITADVYGEGGADAAARALDRGPRTRRLLPRRRGRPRLRRRRARRAPRLSAVHRPAAARSRRVRRLPAPGDRGQPRAGRGRLVRPAPAPQPRPDRVHLGGGLGRDGGPARRRTRRRDRGRPRPGQRLHPRPDRLLRALRRPDRLGDGDPQPARALARRALPRRRGRERRAGDHPGRRLRRPVLGRCPPRPRVRRARPPPLSPRRLGRGRQRAARADAAARRGGRADPDRPRLPVEPGPRPGRLRRPDPDPGGRRPMRGRSRTSGPSWRRSRRSA